MQYYVENTHPAIISKDIFNAAQKLMRERSKRNASDLKLDTPFRQRMVCGIAVRRSDCGEIEIGHIGPANCTANRVKNAAFLKSTNKRSWPRSVASITSSNITVAPFSRNAFNLQKIRYSRMLWSEDVISLNKKISDTLSQVQFLAQLQQAGGVDPDTFITSNNKLNEQLRRLKQEKARLLDTDSDDLADRTRDLMDALEDGPDFLDGFDAELFDALVEKIIVDNNERLRFRLKNGLELLEQIERTRR